MSLTRPSTWQQPDSHIRRAKPICLASSARGRPVCLSRLSGPLVRLHSTFVDQLPLQALRGKRPCRRLCSRRECWCRRLRGVREHRFHASKSFDCLDHVDQRATESVESSYDKYIALAEIFGAAESFERSDRLPDMVSEKASAIPTAARASFCASGVWCPVETRTWPTRCPG